MPHLTTDAPTDATVCRRFRIPSNLLANFMGAIESLTIPENFESFGTMTPEESAEAYFEIMSAFEDKCMIGTVFSYITENPPDGSLPLDGGTYNSADYPDLVAVLFPDLDNGDGTFTLPNMGGRVVGAAGAGFGLTTRDPFVTVGTENVVLTIPQLPSHTHQYLKHDPPAAILTGEIGGAIAADDVNDQPTGATGGGEAHPNMQPTIFLGMAVWAR